MRHRREAGAPRRVALAVGAACGLAGTGIALLAVAASGAGPTPYAVIVGGSATPVAPVTASPSPGTQLVFVNAGANPYVVTRTATPFALATTIAPTSSSSPFTVPSADGSYPYTAQLRQPDNLLGMPGSSGPTISALVVIASPTPAVTGSSPAGVVVAPTGVSVAPTPGSTHPAASRRPRATARASSDGASPSPSVTGTSIAPGGLLPAPAQPPLFSDGAAVPLPVLPTSTPSIPATATASDEAGGTPSAPVTEGDTASTAPAPPVGPIAADAPRLGPRRSRGLPIALAFALLLGVGGAVARTVRRTGSPLRRTR